MRKVTVFVLDQDGISCSTDFLLRDWYCRPSILQSLAFYFSSIRDVSFICCDKYGCSQFLPIESRNYRIHSISFKSVSGNLQSISIEF